MYDINLLLPQFFSLDLYQEGFGGLIQRHLPFHVHLLDWPADRELLMVREQLNLGHQHVVGSDLYQEVNSDQ